jgi:hypothetical protein
MAYHCPIPSRDVIITIDVIRLFFIPGVHSSGTRVTRRVTGVVVKVLPHPPPHAAGCMVPNALVGIVLGF